MTNVPLPDQNDEAVSVPLPEFSSEEYKLALRAFDAAVCEALSVSQFSGGREVAAHISYGTHIFARICIHANAFIRAAPRSRWVRSDADLWDFSAIAPHARAIIEGYLFLEYMTGEPNNSNDCLLKVNIMHLNDCTKRLNIATEGKLHTVKYYRGQAEIIRNRIIENQSFVALPSVLRNKLLTGRYLTVTTRDEQLSAVGWDKFQFKTSWDVLSHYTHILTFSFYNIESNGRGSGLLNDVDRSYIGMFLIECTGLLNKCTDIMTKNFPDLISLRQGIDSKFSPGPRRNLPKHQKRERNR